MRRLWIRLFLFLSRKKSSRCYHQFNVLSLLFFYKFDYVQNQFGSNLKINCTIFKKNQTILAKPVVGTKEYKSTNVQLTANNYSLTTIANRRWSNIFSLSPRHHGRSNLDLVSNSHTNTSSTDNSNNNLTSSSTSSHETAIHNTTASHDEATSTEVGAISAALPAMLCGFSWNSVIRSQTMAGEPKNSVDDNAEQRIAAANIGIKAHSFVPTGLRLNHEFSHFELSLNWICAIIINSPWSYHSFLSKASTQLMMES